MSGLSLFDIAGPIMIGPSSSHTAGAAKIGLLARSIFSKSPQRVTFYLHGSFASVYSGHATDKALLGGVMGMTTSDDRIKNSFEIAKEKGVVFHFKETDLGPDQHENTVKILLEADDAKMEITGCSLGGGVVAIRKVDQFDVDWACMNFRYYSLLLWYAKSCGFLERLKALPGAGRLEIREAKNSSDVTLTLVAMGEPISQEMHDLLKEFDKEVKYRQLALIPV